MNRCMATLIGVAVAGLAVAQAPFTIVRPADGSKVREKVRVMVPKNSVPSGGYVGVFVAGKFVEATVPQPKDKYLEYVLDTKARDIADGPLNIELVLYVDQNDQPRIVDRSSVDVILSNSASIKVPDDGIKLRYKWRIGTEYVYNLETRTQLATLSEAQAKLGARGTDLPVEAEKLRMLYSVDNVFSNGDALLRMQALPTKGKDYAFITTTSSPEGRIFMDYEMHSLYMRVTGTGREMFGSIPFYVPLEGTAGESSRTDLFAVHPLPMLPDKPVVPGDVWQARFQDGNIDLEKLHEQNRVTKSLIARGEFLGVEWESGFPCAKIKHVIEAGANQKPKPDGPPDDGTLRVESDASTGIEDEKESIEETIWFALDRGIIIKVIRDETIERKITAPAYGGQTGGPMGGPTGGPMGGPPGAMGGPMGGPRGGPPGAMGGSGGTLGGPRTGSGGGMNSPGMGLSTNLNQLMQPPGGNTKGGGQGGPPGGAMGGPGGGMYGANRGMTGQNAGGQTRYIRLKVQTIFTLER